MPAFAFRLACLALSLIALLAAARPAAADTVYVTSFTTGELISYDSADPVGTQTVLSPGGSLVSPSAP